MDVVKEYVLATRPWSFTAAVVPVLVTAAVVKTRMLSLEFLQAMTMGVCIQAAANLTNTYYDFMTGVDNKDNAEAGTGEKTLVQKKVSVGGLVMLSVGLYTIGTLSILPLLMRCWPTLLTFISGIALAFFYTATPIGLKYLALGNICLHLFFESTIF